MTKIVYTDLTESDGEPTDRADVGLPLESVDLQFGVLIRMAAKISENLSLSAAITTLVLTVAGCLIAGVAAGIGVSALTATIAGLSVPVGIFILVRVARSLHTVEHGGPDNLCAAERQTIEQGAATEALD
jgi:hypothetical protein